MSGATLQVSKRFAEARNNAGTLQGQIHQTCCWKESAVAQQPAWQRPGRSACHRLLETMTRGSY